MSVLRLRLLACVLGLLGSGCGVFIGDPIQLFPSKLGLDGGLLDLSSPCIEQDSRMSGDAVTIIGVPARNMAALVDLPRSADLTWPGTTASTQVTVTPGAVVVYSVHSRYNENHGANHEDSQCGDHVRIELPLTIATADGQLNESVSKVSFIAYTASEARATFKLAPSAIKGTYKPTSLGNHCFGGTTFNLLANFQGTDGAMIDELHRSCEDPDAGIVVEMAGGHWGPDWLN